MWQPVRYLFPDVELALTGAVRSLLSARPESYAKTVHVSNSVPNPRKDRMVIIRSDGGPSNGVGVAVARVGVNVYGPTKQQATDLARLVGALLAGLPGTGAVTAVPSVSLPFEVEDVSGQECRYLTAEIHFRGTSL